MSSDEKPGRITLTRQPGQSILIGDGVRVTIEETYTGRVVLSITAPRSVKVLREEIADRDT